jgi:hypothetical protein
LIDLTKAASILICINCFQHKMDALIPKPAAQALAAVGLLYLTSKVWSFLRLLASLFLLPGESVSLSTAAAAN